MLVLLLSFKFLGFIIPSILILVFLQWYLVNENKLKLKQIFIAVFSVFIIYYVFSNFLNVLFPTGIF